MAYSQKKIDSSRVVFILWLIKLFHLLKTYRIHFFLVLGKLYTNLRNFLDFFVMISVELPPDDLKTHCYRNAGSVPVVIYFRVLNISEKVNFILTLVLWRFVHMGKITTNGRNNYINVSEVLLKKSFFTRQIRKRSDHQLGSDLSK